MGKNRKRRGRKLRPEIELKEIQSMLRIVKVVVETNDGAGPGSGEYSLMCALAAANGNWPRVKRKTAGDLRIRFELLMRRIENDAPPCEAK